MASIDLPDINVWIALTVKQHPHHFRAMQYWDEEAFGRLAFNSVTAIGFVRVLSNLPKSISTPISVQQAYKIYFDWRAHPMITFEKEPTRCHTVFRQLIDSGVVLSKTCTDAYIAAFAKAGGFRVVTLDRDFKVFRDTEVLHLS